MSTILSSMPSTSLPPELPYPGMTPLDPLHVPLQRFTLIEASAGTGKTYTITTLYVRLLLELSLEVGRILVVTYTNAATAELRLRARQRIVAALDELEGRQNREDETMHELIRPRIGLPEGVQDRSRLLAALHGFDDAAILTIHGFCQRVLQEHAFESGASFEAQLISDQTAMLDEIVHDFWANQLYDAPQPFIRHLQEKRMEPARLLGLAAKAARHPDMPVLPPAAKLSVTADDFSKPALEARVLQLQLDLVRYVREELPRRKDESDLQFFDDLLHRLHKALEGPRGETLAAAIRRRFPALLIDEFQDTDAVQYRIFRRIYGADEGTLFLIGDPKQAIYAFRGADVFAYMAAKRDAGERGHTLLTNYRSDPALVRAINTLFGRARCPFVFDAIPFRPSRPRQGADQASAVPPLRFLFVRRDSGSADGTAGKLRRDDLYEAVASEIVRFLSGDTTINGKPIVPGDIAVLCRTNAQAKAMQQALRELRVPTALLGDASVLDTDEAGDVERLLRAVAEPQDAPRLRAALVTPLFGFRGAGLYALNQDEQAWDAWVRRFQGWRDLWLEAGFATAFRRLIDEASVAESLLALPDGERRLTNVLHLGELLQSAAAEMRRGPRRLIEWLNRLRRDHAARAELAGEATQIRLESDARALRLTTIHKSKGLEYPVVFAPFLWDGNLLVGDDKAQLRFHDPRREDRLTLDLGSQNLREHLKRAEQEALAENLRLLYVALTRARHLCFVVWGKYQRSERSALGYLLHQSDACDAETLARATSDRIKALSDSQIMADLTTLAEASGGTISVAALLRGPVAPYAPAQPSLEELACRTSARDLPLTWRTSSFSALASSGVLVVQAEEGLDRDEGADEPETEIPQPADQALRLIDFPRGTRPGLLVHRLFELLDFGCADEETIRSLAIQTVEAYGIEKIWVDPLCAAIPEILDTPLDEAAVPLTLRRVPSARRLSELEFIFAVGLDDSASTRGCLSPTRLADALLAGGSRVVTRAYAERVRRLSFAPLSGYLKGFIDLVFEHEGRWYLADYKSNDLGPRSELYRATRLLPVMEQHHYVLQYHLYAVALHRYLSQRLRGYEYETHFGGVYYLFVRGMSPRNPFGTGIFSDRPPRALIENLSDVLDDPGRGVNA